MELYPWGLKPAMELIHQKQANLRESICPLKSCWNPKHICSLHILLTGSYRNDRPFLISVWILTAQNVIQASAIGNCNETTAILLLVRRNICKQLCQQCRNESPSIQCRVTCRSFCRKRRTTHPSGSTRFPINQCCTAINVCNIRICQQDYVPMLTRKVVSVRPRAVRITKDYGAFWNGCWRHHKTWLSSILQMINCLVHIVQVLIGRFRAFATQWNHGRNIRSSLTCNPL